MKVSVISKEVHAKPLFSWLVSNGYDVAMLGDNPTAIPSSTDVLVCRHRSCSHQASHLAQSWSKKTGRPMIMENGLKTISKALEKLSVEVVEAKSEKEAFLLNTEKLDSLLEHAPGKTMTWLATCLGTRVDTLIPALMEAKRLSEVSATLALDPVVPANDEDEDVPTVPTLHELEEYAAIILNDRANDPFDVQLSVLRHMADESVDDEVLRSLLRKQEAMQEEDSEEPELEAVVEEPELEVSVPIIEPLPPEESPMVAELPPIPEESPTPTNMMEAFEALRQEVVALRAELRELKTPRASITIDDLLAVGATISITPKDDV